MKELDKRIVCVKFQTCSDIATARAARLKKMIYKIKTGRRTQKSAAKDPKILAGCFFNPQNVYLKYAWSEAKLCVL
jgi:hypothetical protein